MIELLLENVGRKFGQEWVFRSIHAQLKAGDKCAIVGNNGSGKSTLLKMISGALLPSEGRISYRWKGEALEEEQLYRMVSIVGPYTVLPEELTLLELVGFVRRFRQLALPKREFVEAVRLWPARKKQVKYFSSGMKQRLQLGLAFYANSPLVLLDEPSSNLDRENTDWYLSMVEKPMPEQIVVISSNMPREYQCCQDILDMALFK